MTIRPIPIDKIVWDQGIYPREATDQDVVERYMEAMKAGAEFPAIVVVRLEDGYLLLDGNHRVHAAKRLKRKEIIAQILPIDPSDRKKLLIVAAQRNMTHGLPLSNIERKLVIQRLYRMGMTVPELNKIFKIPERTLYRWTKPVRREMEQEKEELKKKAVEMYQNGMTQAEIAKVLGVTQQAVSGWLNDYIDIPSSAKMADDGIRIKSISKPYEGTEIAEIVSGDRYGSGAHWTIISQGLKELIDKAQENAALEALLRSEKARRSLKLMVDEAYGYLDELRERVDRFLMEHGEKPIFGGELEDY